MINTELRHHVLVVKHRMRTDSVKSLEHRGRHASLSYMKMEGADMKELSAKGGPHASRSDLNI